MILFVTGAGGFLGRAVVDAARAAGHDVRALVRDPARWSGPAPDDHLRLVAGDLRAAGAWTEALDGVDVVVHLAATKAGDLHSQFAGTVVGTERLLAELAERPPTRLVHVSTFSVYDYDRLPVGAVLDEDAALVARPETRDEYCQTKLVQERLVRRFAAAAATEVVVVRPGAVWGPGELWDGGGLMGLGPGRTLVVGPRGALKLTYVTNCAEAIVAAATSPAAAGATLNVVDDDPPTPRRFAAALGAAGLGVPRGIPVPYGIVAGLAALLAALNRRFAGGRAKLPGIVVPAKLAAWAKPLRYPNDRARTVLGWQPRLDLDAAARDCADRSGSAS